MLVLLLWKTFQFGDSAFLVIGVNSSDPVDEFTYNKSTSMYRCIMFLQRLYYKQRGSDGFTSFIAFSIRWNLQTTRSRRRQTSPPVPPSGELDETCRLWFGPIPSIYYGNMTLYTKPEAPVHSISQFRQTVTGTDYSLAVVTCWYSLVLKKYSRKAFYGI